MLPLSSSSSSSYNDLIPLLFPQKTTIWSGRIFCIGCSLGINQSINQSKRIYIAPYVAGESEGYILGVCIVLLHFIFISPFYAFVENFTSYVTLYLHACWCYGLRLLDLNKETTYLLTYKILYCAFALITNWTYKCITGERKLSKEIRRGP